MGALHQEISSTVMKRLELVTFKSVLLVSFILHLCSVTSELNFWMISVLFVTLLTIFCLVVLFVP